MKRKEFITLLGVGAGTVVVASCLGGCSKGNDASPGGGGGGGVDFTFDVSTDTNLTNQGWTIKNGIIIAKNGANYIALAGACTHAGSAMTYNSANNTFPCSLQDPGHGSVFNADGIKLSGPAGSNLKKYQTEINGNNLRVFEA